MSHEEGHNLRLMGEIAFARQNFEEAERFFSSGYEIVVEAGDQYESAKTQLSLAQLYIALGKDDLADTALADCLETFERLDARMDLEKAQELKHKLD
jgi:tetratricopeptide (TPR) repeat protein